MRAGRWGGIGFTMAILLAVACGSESTNGPFFDPGGGSDDGGGPSADSGIFSPGNADGSGGTLEDGAPIDDPPEVDLDACAVDKQNATLKPLELVLMQDTSGSMFDYTTGTTSKWTEIKSALATFMSDPASAGIGLGLQFFPLFENNVPNACFSDADCGAAGGQCLYKQCAKTETSCTSDADCKGSGNGCTLMKRCDADREYPCLNSIDCAGYGLVPSGCNQPIVAGRCKNISVSCDPAAYTPLVTPVATLPGAATGINAALSARFPAGLTPTHAALQGAIAAAKARKSARPDASVAVVLSTDGVPQTRGKCTDDPAVIAGVAATAANGTPSIKTFVIGVLSPKDNTSGAATTLNDIANKGGTTSATIIGTSATTQADFIAALQKIRSATLPCEFALPIPPPDAGTPDYQKVNVRYTDAATKKRTLIGYVGEKANCDPAKGGWHYDITLNSDASKPSKVILCPTTCGAVQKNGSVEVVQGCVTRTPSTLPK
jgi:hypothetical protein